MSHDSFVLEYENITLNDIDMAYVDLNVDSAIEHVKGITIT